MLESDNTVYGYIYTSFQVQVSEMVLKLSGTRYSWSLYFKQMVRTRIDLQRENMRLHSRQDSGPVRYSSRYRDHCERLTTSLYHGGEEFA